MTDRVTKTNSVADDDTVDVFGTKDLFSELGKTARPVLQDEGGDDDGWEVLELTPKRKVAEPAVFEDFLLVEGASAGPSSNCSEAQASPRQNISDDDAERSAQSSKECSHANPSKQIQPQARTNSTASTAADEDTYRCVKCGVMLFKTDDIVSSSYHAQTSPGYLLTHCKNQIASSEKLTAFLHNRALHDSGSKL